MVCFLIYIHVTTYFERKRLSHIPSLPLPISWKWYFGHTTAIQKKRLELGGNGFDFAVLFEALREELGVDTYVLYIFGGSIIYTLRVPVIAKVFSDHRTFMKRKPEETGLCYVAGVRVFGPNGILTEAGTEKWYHKRKMMDPAFQKKFLRILMGDITKSSEKMCQYLEDNKDQKTIDIYSLMNRVALEVVCSCGFDLKDDFIMAEDSKLNKAVADVFDILALSILEFFTFPLPWKFRSEKKRLKESNGLLRGIMKEHLSVRLEKITKDPDGISNDILDHIIRGLIGYAHLVKPFTLYVTLF